MKLFLILLLISAAHAAEFDSVIIDNALNLQYATPNAVCTVNGSGNVVSSSVTTTELSYIQNLTSDAQAQITSKQPAGAYVTAGTGDAAFSGPGSATVTLATVATPGTYPKVTFNAKGLVTSGTALSSGDIPNNAANTTGTASNITASTNSSLTTLLNLSLPYSQLTGTPAAPTRGNVTSSTTGISFTGAASAVWGSGLDIEIQTATNSQPGLLSAADHTAFSAKQNALTFGNFTASSPFAIGGSPTGALIGPGVSIGVAAGYYVPTTSDEANWNSVYNGYLNSQSYVQGSGLAVLDLNDVSGSQNDHLQWSNNGTLLFDFYTTGLPTQLYLYDDSTAQNAMGFDQFDDVTFPANMTVGGGLQVNGSSTFASPFYIQGTTNSTLVVEANAAAELDLAFNAGGPVFDIGALLGGGAGPYFGFLDDTTTKYFMSWDSTDNLTVTNYGTSVLPALTVENSSNAQPAAQFNSTGGELAGIVINDPTNAGWGNLTFSNGGTPLANLGIGNTGDNGALAFQDVVTGGIWLQSTGTDDTVFANNASSTSPAMTITQNGSGPVLQLNGSFGSSDMIMNAPLSALPSIIFNNNGGGGTNNVLQFQQFNVPVMDMQSGNSTPLTFYDDALAQTMLTFDFNDGAHFIAGVSTNAFYISQPTCDSSHEGTIWNLSVGSHPDSFQVCQDSTGGGTYNWVSPGFGSVSNVTASSGLTSSGGTTPNVSPAAGYYIPATSNQPATRICTATCTLLITDQFVYANNTGNIAINLPTVVGNTNKTYFIGEIGSGTATVTANGGDTINTQSTQLIRLGDNMSLQDNSIEWRIF